MNSGWEGGKLAEGRGERSYVDNPEFIKAIVSLKSPAHLLSLRVE